MKPAGGRECRSPVAWLAWLVGAAACAALILVVTHLTEQGEFLRLMQSSKPAWLALAVALQLATYFAQGNVWQTVSRASGHRLGISETFKLSLAMLFVNQALPSGGISGLALVKAGLDKSGMAPAVVAAAVLVDIGTYYFAYAVCMATAVLLAPLHGNVPIWVLLLASVFVLAGMGIAWIVMALPSARLTALKSRMTRFPRLASLMEWLVSADPRLYRDRAILARCFLCHASIFALDAATVWVAVHALGTVATPAGVFVSFMVSTLFRTIGFMPGGLGTFETASVGMLKLAGLSLPASLSATLLFRGLSFWLPMVPGLMFSRRLIRGNRESNAPR